MTKVDKLAEELADAILESEEYQTYLKCKDEISKNPQLFQAVNELRKANFAIQNDVEVADTYDEVVRIYDKYAYIRTNVIANRFLRSENSICKMIQDIQRTLLENIDLDTEFLD